MTASGAAPRGQRLYGIKGFRLVTQDLPRLVAFYREVLGFAAVGDIKTIGTEEMGLLGLQGGGRRQDLSIGSQTVAIDEFEIQGHSYPVDASASSLCFQHLALVVVDIGEAHARLRDVVSISTAGPQQLPASSGGVQAFKFRDPDGHPLELVQFPQVHMLATWKNRSPAPGQIALGIDHSAISVHDADTSVAFYGDLTLKQGKRAFNTGPAQERLDGLACAEVAVVPMIPDTAAPHLELLAYLVPELDRSPTMRVNDIAATRILWRGDKTDLLRDPDGHFQQIEP